MKDDNKEIIKVSYFYYKLNLSQQEIADKLNISRQKVNRLIQRALSENIVEIKINGYENFDINLEYNLEQKYGLESALVVKDNNNEEPIGIAASNYMNKLIKKILENEGKCSIGISWGNALSNLIRNYQIPKEMNGDISVIQMLGGINTQEVPIKPEEITNKLAILLGGKSYNLFAPAFLKNKALVDMLCNETYYKNIVTKYKDLDMAVVGIGKFEAEGNLVENNYIEREDYLKLKNKGGVGDVCLRIYDSEGKNIDSDFDKSVMGISLLDFVHIPIRIGIAYGKDKIRPILGAIRGNYINVLVTDEETAKLILKLD